MNYYWVVIPFLSSFIGYITNVFAIKLLFWPHKPINLVFFKVQGLLPKRQADIAAKIGELVEQQLLSLDDVIDKVNTPEFREKIIVKLNIIMQQRLDAFLPNIIPSRLNRLIKDSLEKLIRQEASELITQILEYDRGYLANEIQVKRIVEVKIQGFDLNEMEEIIKSVSSTELKFIEILGGVLGFIIGLIQVAMLYILP